MLDLTHNLPFTLGPNCFHFGNSSFSLQLAILIDIFQMLGNRCLLDIEDSCHLLLGKPNRIASRIQPNFNGLIGCVVDNDGSFVFRAHVLSQSLSE